MFFKIHIFLIICLINFKVMDTFNQNFDDDEEGEEDDEDEEEAILSASTLVTKFVGNKGPLSFLDRMLSNYDRRAWPTYGTGKPTEVAVNFHINSMSYINAARMEFNVDLYLRQYWMDKRLALSRFGINHTVNLNGQDIIDKVWKPGIFFKNEKSAKFHKVTVPNKMIQLSPDGAVLLSMRLTLRLSCHMLFHNFPLDTQKCWIILGSYTQSVDQILLSWAKEKPIVIEEGVMLPEFDLIVNKPGSEVVHFRTGNYSFLNTSFLFVRQNGYHLVQTYLPTFLIVTISWVSFWLHVDATPARVTLGVTTLLTLTTVASGVRTQLPPVAYVKAIDIWIGACSVMVFGALLEFTLVNYLSRRKVKPPQQSRHILNFCKGGSDIEKTADDVVYECTEEEKRANLKRALAVDRISRILFPFLFFIFNLSYWIYYLYPQ